MKRLKDFSEESKLRRRPGEKQKKLDLSKKLSLRKSRLDSRS